MKSIPHSRRVNFVGLIWARHRVHDEFVVFVMVMFVMGWVMSIGHVCREALFGWAYSQMLKVISRGYPPFDFWLILKLF